MIKIFEYEYILIKLIKKIGKKIEEIKGTSLTVGQSCGSRTFRPRNQPSYRCEKKEKKRKKKKKKKKKEKKVRIQNES